MKAKKNIPDSCILLLGTGTCQLQTHRMASSALICLDGFKFLFDCGRGTCLRLTQIGIRQDDLKHIVLSHFHPDHTSDLIPWLQSATWSRCNPRKAPLTIYGPIGTVSHVNGLVSSYGKNNLLADRFEFAIRENNAPQLQVGPLKMKHEDLPPAGNRGIKFNYKGLTCALTGDSYAHGANRTFLKDVDLAIIDAGHPNQEELTDLLAASQPRTVVCSHLYQEYNEKELTEAARKKGFNGTLIVPLDGLCIELPTLRRQQVLS